ncbi:MAG: reverse transcriptase domain-containing protein, partial [Parcubacteria group bacterium]
MNYNELVGLDNILSCWREFKRGKMKKADVMEFDRHREDNIFRLHEELMNRTYCHGSYRSFNVYDPVPRVISKASVRDRLVHRVVFDELYRIFDPTFYFHSYSSRLEKGTHLAIQNLSSCLRRASRNYTHNVYILKCDIRKFFASVNHDKLLEIICERVADENILSLIKKIIDSFPVGLPLGNV